MGVTYPSCSCESSRSGSHYFLILAGSIWRCQYCWVAKWLPRTLDEAIQFSYDIRKLGVDGAYQRELKQRPNIKRLLGKLEEIRLLRKVLPEKELMMAIAAIVKDKSLEGFQNASPAALKQTWKTTKIRE